MRKHKQLKEQLKNQLGIYIYSELRYQLGIYIYSEIWDQIWDKPFVNLKSTLMDGLEKEIYV